MTGRTLRGVTAVALVVLVATLGGCAGTKEAASQPTLYERLGGRHPIKLVVDDFVANLVADPRVNARFKDMKPADVERFKTNAADQVCEATGGPCSYLGKDMKTVHKGMNITEAEWDATIEDLVKALDKHKVGAREKNELLGALGAMKKDIVGQ